MCHFGIPSLLALLLALSARELHSFRTESGFIVIGFLLFMYLVNARMSDRLRPPEMAFASILTVDTDIDIVLGGGPVRVPDAANVPSLIRSPNVAQH